MEFTARITQDARTGIAKGGKQVVNFSVAINDSYKPKDGERKEYTTYIDVAWWRGTAIAQHLTKGTVVTISGRIYSSIYTDKNGTPKPVINCNANEIKIMHYGKKDKPVSVPVPQPADLTEPLDDLPF